ncbi:MAG TPA: hypothetical protein VJ770_07590 [Stellaceae bacterium]|nr:hypothetical protein [Stellaceae bacterium]
MEKPIDFWNFVVRVVSIGLDVEFGLHNSQMIRRESLRIQGTVIVGQRLIEKTTVYATIWAGDDLRAKEAHRYRLGSAFVAKDVETIRTFSGDDPFQIAGIDIHIPLLQSQFRELQDSLALANASQMTLSFGCVGPSLVKPRPSASPELILQDKNIDLSILRFSINFGM